MQACVNSWWCLRGWSSISCSNPSSCRRVLPAPVDSIGHFFRRKNLCVTHCQVSSTDTKRDDGDSWVVENADTVRSLPLFVGGASFTAVLLNRAFSGIASVADASSAQSRADVLALALCATVVLTGLIWKSIKSKPQSPVPLYGVECMRVASFLPARVVRELMWTWESLEKTTRTRTMVVVYRNRCILQAGVAAESKDQGGPELVDANRVLEGSLYKAFKESKKQSYLANLALYPSRFELPFLPSGTQAVILQPLGEDGVLILGGDTLRGFGPKDQVGPFTIRGGKGAFPTLNILCRGLAFVFVYLHHMEYLEKRKIIYTARNHFI